MKNILILAILFFSINALTAQGLSGKRFTIFYNADYHGSTAALISGFEDEEDAFGYYNFKDDAEKSILKSVINFRHSINLNYILNRKTAIGLQMGWSRDAYGAVDVIVNNFRIPVTANYKCLTTEGEIKFFKSKRKGAIAPIGGYFALRAGVSSVKTNAKITSRLLPDAEEIQTEDTDFNAFSLAMVWGKQFIMYKKIMMNVGFEIKHTFISEDERTPDTFNSIFSPTSESPKTRVYWNDFLRLTIGIGLAPL